MDTAQTQSQNSSSVGDTKSLVDILIEQGDLDAERGNQVKTVSIQSGKNIEEIILSQNLVSEEALIRAKASLYNVGYVDLTSTPVSPEALSALSQEVADRFKVFPISLDSKNKEFVLAMADPLNLSAIEFIEQKTGFRVVPKAATPSQVRDAIVTRYTSTLSKEVTEALKEVGPNESVDKKVGPGRTGFIREERVAEIVSHILDFAVKSRASDVHIEPQVLSTRVRYRVDGILQEKLTIPKALHEALVSRIKILSGMKIDEKRIPQDGRFNFKSSQEVDLRVSSMPTSTGEKIVMRLLKKSGGAPDITELGLRGRALKNLQDAILRPHGIILICGPTGSGKTTTLYSLISKLSTQKVNIMTLEDPVEYRMDGVNQVQVNPLAGLTFATGLRAFLRQDPNIILVGEIRDKETMELAIQASLTGHLVFSTLHTNDASGALPRLLDMGAEPFLLASSMTAIVGQRVARKIHEKCKVAYEPDQSMVEEMQQSLGTLASTKMPPKFFKGQGDAECGHSGYFGRIGIFEVLPVSEKIGRLILERSPASEMQKVAVQEGMITMKQDGFSKVLDGITSIEEVLRVAQE